MLIRQEGSHQAHRPCQGDVGNVALQGANAQRFTIMGRIVAALIIFLEIFYGKESFERPHHL